MPLGMTTTHYYKAALYSAPGRYHRAQRGGNKRMIEYLERNNYDNKSLLACCKVSRGNNNNKLNKHIMATKNFLQSELGKQVMNGVRSRIFDDFGASLLSSLASSASNHCGVGRITYAALIATWRKDTVNGAYTLNEAEGRKLYTANPADARLRRIGVDGHWSYFVAPPAKDASNESDSITVLVGGWLRSWSSWFASVVQYGHYGEGGVPAASSVTPELLERCKSLWSSRGVGGRTAASAEEKAQKKVAKAVAGLSSAELLAALRASGVDLSALVGSAPQTASANDSDNNE